jgi:alpha-beta hydrolase superfamily lysophospholipase
VSRFRKWLVVRPTTEGGYGATLHRDYGGEFDYNLQWKPIGGFPVTSGWIHAIRRGQAKLHGGLDVGVPNLILRSDRSVREVSDPDAIQRGDAVLDVKQIARWAGCIGNRTTVVPIADAKHDVFLSVAESRQLAYRELDRWLDWYIAWSESAGATPQPERG